MKIKTHIPHLRCTKWGDDIYELTWHDNNMGNYKTLAAVRRYIRREFAPSARAKRLLKRK